MAEESYMLDAESVQLLTKIARQFRTDPADLSDARPKFGGARDPRSALVRIVAPKNERLRMWPGEIVNRVGPTTTSTTTTTTTTSTTTTTTTTCPHDNDQHAAPGPDLPALGGVDAGLVSGA